jgi:hypothetical protein
MRARAPHDDPPRRGKLGGFLLLIMLKCEQRASAQLG